METLHRLRSVLFETVQQTNSASLSFCEQGRTVMDAMMVQSKNRVGEALEYYEYLLSIGDKRVENWGLMQSPVPTILITMAYLLMCFKGPSLMAKYPAFSIRPLIVVYNLFCAALNFYIGYEIFVTSRTISYSWTCQPVDYSLDPSAVRIARALWWYYISKLLELCDSLFIILRKRDQQLSFLHIYHHATMFPLWWIGAKYVAGGSSFLGALFNCCVHVVMYSYYALSAVGGRFKRFLWWKKYLTVLQMVQFVAALVMGINAIRIGCDFPMWMQYTCCLYMVSFLVLFSDFYYKAYLDNKCRVASQAANGHVVPNGSVQLTKNGVHNGRNSALVSNNGLNKKID